MAAGFIQRVGAATVNSTGSPSSITIDVANATAAGLTVLVAVSVSNATTISSVTDTEHNVYTQEYGNSGLNRDMEIWRADNITALTTSDSITANLGTGEALGIVAIADAFNGIGRHDSSSGANVGASSPESGSITAKAGDIVLYSFYMFAGAATAISVNSTFTGTGPAALGSGGSAEASGLTGYDPSPSAGSVSSTYTFSPSGVHTGVIIMVGFPARSGLLMASFP